MTLRARLRFAQGHNKGGEGGPAQKRAVSEKRLQELQAEGIGIVEIANRLGVTWQAIYKRIADGG